VLQGHYVVADASGQKYMDTAQLISIAVDFTSPQCLRFYYYMNASDVQLLKVGYCNYNFAIAARFSLSELNFCCDVVTI